MAAPALSMCVVTVLTCRVSFQEAKIISTTEDTEDTENRPKGKRLNFLCVLCVLCGSTKTANHNHRIESQHVSSLDGHCAPII